MQSSSSKNLRVRSTSNKSPNRPMSPQKKFDHKKQIQATLNELHQLQAQIYSLNVPQNPHSSGPIKKQIKQLSYLYESMTKPKIKNKLNMQMNDIKSALQIMNQGMKAIDQKANVNNNKGVNSVINNNTKNQLQAKQISLLKQFVLVQKQQQQQQSRLHISTKTLKHLMKQLYNTQFDISLVSQSKTSKVNQLSCQQIQKFINYNQFDNFDPIKQAYNALLDDNGNFSFKRYNQINSMFGLPKVKQLNILKSAIGLDFNQQMTFEKFKEIMQEGQQLGIA